ncbi:CheR family methyltransferase [Deferribacter abyssi]|uniref:CheR family methyltransferase n=1 Tax=Deferribacter abyssi TaxID=213806 RepID=UPI003C29AF1C
MDKTLFNILCKKIENVSGFRVYSFYESNLLTILNRIAEKRITTVDEIIEESLKNMNLLEEIIESLVINETFFYRHENQFKLIEEKIIPDISKNYNTITIWSAGCSTGCEPYTIAMIIDKRYPHLKDRITIIGTDIDREALNIAENGEFSKWHIRNLANNVLNTYFTKKNNIYYLSENIKKMVNFKRHNLLHDPFFSNCHIILCRNVLIYFSQENITHILKRFINDSLVENGYLFLAPGEFTLLNSLGFTPLNIQNTFVYKKSSNITDITFNRQKHSINFKKIKKNLNALLLSNKKDDALNYLHNISFESSKDVKNSNLEELVIYIDTGDIYNLEKKIKEFKFTLNDDEYFFLIGMKYYLKNDYKNALDNFRKATMLKDDYIYYFYQALSLKALGDLENAKIFFTLSLKFFYINSIFESLVNKNAIKKIILNHISSKSYK